MLNYSVRSEKCRHPLTKKLFSIMDEKKSNLSLAADVTRSQDLLTLADQLGPYICVLKTHIDICDDFTSDLPQKLKELAEKHKFLIFEDRKFADIGNTVLEQYRGGVYNIADWAPITNAHCVPGEGIIQGLAKVGVPKGNGLLLLAEMSSKGTLAHGEYTQTTVQWAEKYSNFVMGFICTRKLSDNVEFVHMMPGVKMAGGGDTLGQQYLTPEKAIERGADIIIVGRGITSNEDPVEAAKRYRDAGFEAYSSRISV